MAKQTGRGSDQFPLRLPDGMRDRLKEAASESGRSMNAELVNRLEQSFAPLGSDADILNAFDKDVSPRARVVARLMTAALSKTEALDLVLLDPALYARIEAHTTSGSPHDAARRAIEDAFPTRGVTWGELAQELSGIDLSKLPKLAALHQFIDGRIKENPAIATAIAS